MSYISDKIAEVRGMGHVVPEGIEELFLAIESEIGLDKKQKKPANQITNQSNTYQQAAQNQNSAYCEGVAGENPLNGERIDS